MSVVRRAAIVGIGQTEFSKESGRSELQLACEAVRAAIADSGLQPSDVDGLVTFVQDPNDELGVMLGVGIPEVRWTSRTPFVGGGASATIEHAAAAVPSTKRIDTSRPAPNVHPVAAINGAAIR